MKRANLRAARIVLGLVGLFVVLPARGAEEKAPAKKRPHTDSGTPFVHRIQLRDEQDNPISVPKTGTEAERAAKIKLASIATTCGKCHDYPAISVGWHFNAADPKIAAGRAGEPWILTDDAVPDDPKTGAPAAATRSQIPLSYRGWARTWKPSDVGMNDWRFAQAFGRHMPGGGIFETSRDQRFGVSGFLQWDPLESTCRHASLSIL